MRIALLLGGFRQPRWIHGLVSELVSDPRFRIVLAAVGSAGAPAAWPLALYERVDRGRYARPGDALSPSDLSPLLAGVPVIRPAQGGPLDDVTHALVRAHAPDVTLRLGVPEAEARAAELAVHGVWSLRSGSAADGFAEVAGGAGATPTELCVLGERAEGDRVLARTWSQTDGTSLHADRERRATKGGALVRRALERLAHGDAPALSDAPTPATSERTPGTLVALGGVARVALRRGGELARRAAFAEHWTLAAATSDAFPPDARAFVDWLPPPGLLWADPFPVSHGGSRFVFLEECALGAPRAHLAVLEVGADGRPGPARRVLERPYHLSYPFLFAWQGELFLLPETAENRTVELYRCEVFPHRWTRERILLSGLAAYDATLLEHEGRWWMFACVAVPGGPPLDELHVFHAPEPVGPWTPVPGNPVVSDVRRARPAGRFFRHDGAWIRPSQDSSGRYGRAVRFQRVERLDPEGYAEREVAALEPGWRPDVLAVHTYNRCDGLTVVDFVRRRRRF